MDSWSRNDLCNHTFCGSCTDRGERVDTRNHSLAAPGPFILLAPDDVTSVCSGGAYGMARCPVCRRFSKKWTHVRPVCRDLVDSPPIPEAIPTAIATPRFEPSVRRALQGICCATCHALSGLFCADRAPDTDPPREKRLRACASQQTVAAAAESSRGTKNSRKRSAKEAAAEEAEDGGFTLESRGLVRAAGEAVAVGDDRTCLPDALWICLTACGKQIKLSAVRKSMVHLDDNSDPTYAMAKSTALQYGMQLAHISRLKASPAGLFNYDCGMFLVRLRIECATGTDYHYVAYNAQTGRIFDNERYAKVPRVEATDKRNNKSATKVFFQLFPKAKEIWVDAVSVAQINSTY